MTPRTPYTVTQEPAASSCASTPTRSTRRSRRSPRRGCCRRSACPARARDRDRRSGRGSELPRLDRRTRARRGPARRGRDRRLPSPRRRRRPAAAGAARPARRRHAAAPGRWPAACARSSSTPATAATTRAPRGPTGTLEKDVTLAVARRLKAAARGAARRPRAAHPRRRPGGRRSTSARRSRTTTRRTCSSACTPTRRCGRDVSGARGLLPAPPTTSGDATRGSTARRSAVAAGLRRRPARHRGDPVGNGAGCATSSESGSLAGAVEAQLRERVRLSARGRSAGAARACWSAPTCRRCSSRSASSRTRTRSSSSRSEAYQNLVVQATGGRRDAGSAKWPTSSGPRARRRPPRSPRGWRPDRAALIAAAPWSRSPLAWLLLVALPRWPRRRPPAAGPAAAVEPAPAPTTREDHARGCSTSPRTACALSAVEREVPFGERHVGTGAPHRRGAARAGRPRRSLAPCPPARALRALFLDATAATRSST